MEAIPQTPTEPVSDQNDELRNIKEDMENVKEIKQAANVLEKFKVRINCCIIVDTWKFRKTKTCNEIVKEKETERQDEKVFGLEKIKVNLLRNEVVFYACVLSAPLVCCDTSVFKNSANHLLTSF